MLSVDRLIAGAASWDAFFARTRALPASAPGATPDKGKAFERLTQLYLRTHPEYQTRLRHVWRAKDELPPAIRARVRLPRTDEGVDLVAETLDGDLWAIQCKFRAETHKPLTVTELSTFTNLAFNVCRGFSLAVVAHTCSKPVRKAALLGRATEIGLDRWLELGAEDWRRIRAAAARKAPPRPKPRSPRPHQRRAVADAKRHFIDGKAARGRMIMPCGTGKSLTAFWIAEALAARSILVAVPSLSLIKQSLGDWTREFLARGEVPDWLCVCGDESTGRLEHDEFVGGVYELGVDATTDPKAIAAFLSRRGARRKIVFATYQSGKPLAAAARTAGFRFDLGIMDEAHRTVGSPDKAFGHLLLARNLPVARRLFMTATERVVRGADETVLSMDDPAVYGECFHQLSFKAAIAARPPIISDYRILTITVSDERVKRLIAENRYLRTADRELGEREAQALAAGIALQRAFREEGVRHAISFHRSIRAAEQFRGQQERIEAGGRRAGRPACYHISSRKSAGERAELLQEFRESPSALITNARCLQEGVDIPAVDCVLFADPKQSVVDIVQAAGRAMRPSRGKRCGYIVVPIVVPSGMSFAAFAETTEFKQVARVVTALSTQDDRIAEEFRGVKGKRRSRGAGRIVEIRGDVPVAMRVDLEKFREQVRLRLWERVGRVNWRPFEEARTFVRKQRLRNYTEWLSYRKSDRLPPDVPANPNRSYAGIGWAGYGDWLGTGTVSRRFRRYRPFAEARAFVRSLNLKSQKEWVAHFKGGRLPPDIPSSPSNAYRGQGWAGFGDWLGTGTIALFLRQYRSFTKARAWAHALHLKSSTEWRVFCKSGRLPSDVPAKPSQTYRDHGWSGFGDWLGTGAIATRRRRYRHFPKARAFVHRLKLKSVGEWRKFCKSGHLPADIPANPDQTYRNKGWASYGDWTGTGIVAPQLKKYRPFAKARAFARALGLESQKEWLAFTRSGRLPSDIPAIPYQTYQGEGWAGIGDWLGTGTVATSRRRYRRFALARVFVRRLGLKNVEEWKVFTKSDRFPADIPMKPDHVYRNHGWAGYGDWLGTGTVATFRRKYRPFREARAWARSLGLNSQKEWFAYTKSDRLPSDIPAVPRQTYLDKGWTSYPDWLGTK